MNLNYFAGFVEENNLYGFEPGELSRGVAKFFFCNLLENKDLADFFVSIRTDAGGLTLSREMPLTPLPDTEQEADQELE